MKKFTEFLRGAAPQSKEGREMQEKVYRIKAVVLGDKSLREQIRYPEENLNTAQMIGLRHESVKVGGSTVSFTDESGQDRLREPSAATFRSANAVLLLPRDQQQLDQLAEGMKGKLNPGTVVIVMNSPGQELKTDKINVAKYVPQDFNADNLAREFLRLCTRADIESKQSSTPSSPSP